MKKLMLIVALMLMGCGNPAEPEYEVNLQVSRLENFHYRATWDEYTGDDFYCYYITCEHDGEVLCGDSLPQNTCSYTAPPSVDHIHLSVHVQGCFGAYQDDWYK